MVQFVSVSCGTTTHTGRYVGLSAAPNSIIGVLLTKFIEKWMDEMVLGNDATVA